MKKKPILLDVMQGDRFICKMEYTKRGTPTIVDDKIREVYDMGDIEKFVYESRPSLRGRGVRIAISNSRVIRT